MRIERSVRIAASPEAVFDVIADPATHTEWRPSAAEFRTVDGGRLSRESELVEVVRFLGREYRTTYQVLELDRPQALTVASSEGPLPVLLRTTLERDDWRTRVTFAFETVRPRITGVPVPFFGALMGWYMMDEGRRLKKLVEDGRSSRP